jgi:hypothetical protein
LPPRPPYFLFCPSLFPLLQAAPACRIHSAYRKEGWGEIINPRLGPVQFWTNRNGWAGLGPHPKKRRGFVGPRSAQHNPSNIYIKTKKTKKILLKNLWFFYVFFFINFD